MYYVSVCSTESKALNFSFKTIRDAELLFNLINLGSDDKDIEVVMMSEAIAQAIRARGGEK